MRPIVLTAALIALMPAASDAADQQIVIAKPSPRVTIIHPFGPVEPARIVNPFGEAKDCPETPMSLARKRGEKPMLKHLDELPPAEAFAAVDRRIANCPAPLYLSETKGR